MQFMKFLLNFIDIYIMTYVANIMNGLARLSLEATFADHKARNDEKNAESPSNLEQLRKIFQDINFTRILKSGDPEPAGKSASPIYVIQILHKWLHSVKNKPGFHLIENIILEEDEEQSTTSNRELQFGEDLFKKESEFCFSRMNHEFEHIKDRDITINHLKKLLSTMAPDKIRDILLGNRVVLLHQHYEKVLDSILELLKEDQKFRRTLSSAIKINKNRQVMMKINDLLSKEITKEKLGALGFFLLNHTQERKTINEYLKKNYGIPSLHSFLARSTSLYKIDSRLAEIYGKSRITFYSELSAEFAELSQIELRTIHTSGAKKAKETIEKLLQLAYDAGKIDKSKFLKITGKVPIKGKIYTGPTLLP